MENNNTKRLNLSTQVQRWAARVLLVVWLLSSCSPVSALPSRISLYKAVTWTALVASLLGPYTTQGQNIVKIPPVAEQKEYFLVLADNGGQSAENRSVTSLGGHRYSQNIGEILPVAEQTGYQPGSFLPDNGGQSAEKESVTPLEDQSHSQNIVAIPPLLPVAEQKGYQADPLLVLPDNGGQSAEKESVDKVQKAAEDIYNAWLAFKLIIQLIEHDPSYDTTNDMSKAEIDTINGLCASIQTVGKEVNTLLERVSSNNPKINLFNYTIAEELQNELVGQLKLALEAKNSLIVPITYTDGYADDWRSGIKSNAQYSLTATDEDTGGSSIVPVTLVGVLNLAEDWLTESQKLLDEVPSSDNYGPQSASFLGPESSIRKVVDESYGLMKFMKL